MARLTKAAEDRLRKEIEHLTDNNDLLDRTVNELRRNVVEVSRKLSAKEGEIVAQKHRIRDYEDLVTKLRVKLDLSSNLLKTVSKSFEE